MNNKKMNKKGFTIVELVIVIAVIAILAGVMIPTFGGIIKTANESAVKQAAAATFKDLYAVDLSDGTLDAPIAAGADPAANPAVPCDPQVTALINSDYSSYSIEYSVSDNKVAFSYTDSVKNIKVATTDSGETWTVTNPAS